MKVTIIFLISVLTIVFGFSNNKHSNIEKEAIIAGKVLNHNKHPDKNTIKVFEYNFVNPFGRYHTAFLENDGTFKIEFQKSYSSDVYIIYGNMAMIFVGPGDSVYIEFDAEEFLYPNQENIYKPKSLKFSGSNKQINEEIKTYIGELNYSINKIREANNSEGSLLPEDYLTHLKFEKKKKTQLLDSLIQTGGFSKEFIKWARFSIDYSFGASLFHYTWYNPLSKNKGNKTFEVIDIPNSFYEAVKEIPLDCEDAIICRDYFRFLHEYSLTNTDFNSELFKRSKEFKGKNRNSDSLQIAFEDLLHTIKKEYTGIAYELLLSQNLYALMDPYKAIDVFDKLYPKYEKEIRSDFRDILYEKNSELKDTLVPNDKNLSKLDAKIETVATEILSDILSKNKGKVIYLDFWATWCGPCLMEFELSKKLAKTFENKNVEFVYLCVKSEKGNWEDKLREYNLPGKHYLLNDSEYDVLSQKFQVVGIPHYVLIDKSGNVVDKNAPRPSSDSEAINLIEKYLD